MHRSMAVLGWDEPPHSSGLHDVCPPSLHTVTVSFSEKQGITLVLEWSILYSRLLTTAVAVKHPHPQGWLELRKSLKPVKPTVSWNMPSSHWKWHKLQEMGLPTVDLWKMTCLHGQFNGDFTAEKVYIYVEEGCLQLGVIQQTLEFTQVCIYLFI